jgi:hypothetical protein
MFPEIVYVGAPFVRYCIVAPLFKIKLFGTVTAAPVIIWHGPEQVTFPVPKTFPDEKVIVPEAELEV